MPSSETSGSSDDNPALDVDYRTSMKQGTLGFTAGKRRVSSVDLATGKASRSSSKPSPSAEPASSDIINIASSDSDHDSLSYSIESDNGDQATRKGKRTTPDSIDESEDESMPAPKKRRLRNANSRGVFGLRNRTENRKSEESTLAAKAKGKRTQSQASLEPRKEKTELADLPKDGRWTKHYGVVREKMGNLEPVHDEGKSPVDHILHVFDMSYEYGPCIGVTRLERWDRAEALGLHPPPEVKEILLTKEGSEDPRFSESAFYGEV